MEKQDSRVLIHWEGNSGDKLIEHQTSSMGNGQDWVGTAERLDGETDTVPKEGTILSF